MVDYNFVLSIFSFSGVLYRYLLSDWIPFLILLLIVCSCEADNDDCDCYQNGYSCGC